MDESPLESIIDKATILSETAFLAKFPSGKISRKSRDYGNTFLCRRGCHTGTTTYTDEFSWDDIAHSTHEEVLQLTERLVSETKARRKKRAPKRTREDSFVDDELAADEEFGTPRKRQKNSLVSTPKKPRTPSKLLTPSHKR